MANGVINISFKLLYLLLFLSIIGCKKGNSEKVSLLANNILELEKNDSVNLVLELYDNGIVKLLHTENKSGIKNGLSLSYYPNGITKEKFNWRNGKLHGGYWIYNELGEVIKFYNYEEGEKSGDMYEYVYDSFIQTHRIFRNNDAIYSEIFEEGKKIFNSPIPIFLEETINDTIYETRIRFPFKFNGNLEILLRDSVNFEKEYIDKYNLNLKITNFDREWKKYELRLVYEPSENDTLIWTDYVYNRTISID